ELVAQAYAGKGAAARAVGSTGEALAAYEAAIARFEGHEGTASREIVAASLFDRGELLAGLGRSEEALQSFDSFLARLGPVAAPGVASSDLTKPLAGLYRQRWPRLCSTVRPLSEPSAEPRMLAPPTRSSWLATEGPPRPRSVNWSPGRSSAGRRAWRPSAGPPT